LICDTGGIINALTAGMELHEECLGAINRADQLVLSPLALCEIGYLVAKRQGSSAAAQMLSRLAEPEYEIASFTTVDLTAAIDVMRTYEDLSIGLTDASMVILAKRYKTNEILTLDQGHFRAMRGLDGRHFRLLPFDID
jgi:hypothetical protein